jgi:putative PIN family toxin of toxin-antitoxin system
MTRAFIDTSVLFSACYSPTGASSEIIREAVQGTIGLVISRLVLEEAKRNLAQKLPQALPLLTQLLEVIPFEVVRPSKQEVLAAAAYTELKDAPIVAAAKAAQVDYLVSLDRRHLVDVAIVRQQSGLTIVLPEAFLTHLRHKQPQKRAA